jgi:hypothetical protein
MKSRTTPTRSLPAVMALLGMLATGHLSTAMAGTRSHPESRRGPGRGYAATAMAPPSGEIPGRSPQEAPARPPEGTRDAPYIGHGVIQGIERNRLEVRHEAIPGLMGAMTMVFSTSDEVSTEDLEVGDEIVFNIEVLPEYRYQIFHLETVTNDSEEDSTGERDSDDSDPTP